MVMIVSWIDGSVSLPSAVWQQRRCSMWCGGIDVMWQPRTGVLKLLIGVQSRRRAV